MSHYVHRREVVAALARLDAAASVRARRGGGAHVIEIDTASCAAHALKTGRLGQSAAASLVEAAARCPDRTSCDPKTTTTRVADDRLGAVRHNHSEVRDGLRVWRLLREVLLGREHGEAEAVQVS